MKVLIVEDDKNLCQATKRALDKEFIVQTASTGQEALNLANDHHPQVILLDIMLPDVTGYDLIPSFKKNDSPVVIMVSALEEEDKRILAYEKGADDYMIKPVTLLELNLKLKALKSRVAKHQPVIYLGDLIYKTKSKELIYQNNRVSFPPGQASIFSLLYDKYQKGEILTKEEILAYEGGNQTMSMRVHTAISRIRKNLDYLGCDDVFIENIYGQGYQLVVVK